MWVFPHPCPRPRPGPAPHRKLYRPAVYLKYLVHTLDWFFAVCVWGEKWKNLYKSHLCSASSAKTNDGNKFTRAQDQNKDNADCQNQSQPEILYTVRKKKKYKNGKWAAEWVANG